MILCFVRTLCAQHLGVGLDIGLKGGVPFTDQLQVHGQTAVTTTLAHSSEYLIGPVVELRLPLGFAVEADALYRHADYRATTSTLLGSLTNTVSAGSWEIPYLAKYRFPFPLLKPFIDAGGAYRSIQSNGNFTATNNAFVLGGGLELRLSRLRLSGELRYLRWQSDDTQPALRLTPNQGELLFGLTF